MSDSLNSRHTLDSLKKEAKRWLAALRDGSADAQARFKRVLGAMRDAPVLRDVQHALAREHGFPGWTKLKEAFTPSPQVSATTLARYEEMAQALLDAYNLGTPEAMERHYSFTWHRREWRAMRTYVQGDLGKRPATPGGDVEITIDDARFLVAAEYGFENWEKLTAYTAEMPAGVFHTNKPTGVAHSTDGHALTGVMRSREWGAVLARLEATPNAVFVGAGEVTDEMMRDIARIPTIVGLGLDGSQKLTDAGAAHLAGMAQLRFLRIGGTAITDRALASIGELRALEMLTIGMTRITDAGLASLAPLKALREFELMWTRTGDGAIRAMEGNMALRRLVTGGRVTDAGIAALHGIPAFKSWLGGDTRIEMMSYESKPNQLHMSGPFTDRGMEAMRGLDGLFGLNIAHGEFRISAKAMIPLASLPMLSWLATDPRDDWAPHIAAIPKLRFLGAQDTEMTDVGFTALAQSQTLEKFWGRKSLGLRDRGFRALATMPMLKSLSTSMRNVSDEALAILPEFPSLRELMPMDVPDASYRHIGKCSELERLVLMYCRDTTDGATEHITGLRKLQHYFNSYTTITDRTPELLSAIDSLEEVIFDQCHSLTDAGIARLARLPKVRELRVAGNGVTPALAKAFPPGVKVSVGG